MADSDRVVYPDEVEDVKAEIAGNQDKVEGGDSNSIEEAPEQPSLALRNMITVPSNCPEGYQMGADGVCRQVF